MRLASRPARPPDGSSPEVGEPLDDRICRARHHRGRRAVVLVAARARRLDRRRRIASRAQAICRVERGRWSRWRCLRRRIRKRCAPRTAVCLQRCGPAGEAAAASSVSTASRPRRTSLRSMPLGRSLAATCNYEGDQRCLSRRRSTARLAPTEPIRLLPRPLITLDVHAEARCRLAEDHWPKAWTSDIEDAGDSARCRSWQQ